MLILIRIVFAWKKVNFLGFIIGKNGVEGDEEKVKFMLILISVVFA